MPLNRVEPMLIIALIQILVPLALLTVIAFQSQPGTTQFVLTTLAIGAGLFFLWLVMPWDVTSVYYRQALPVLFLAAVFVGFRRIGTQKKKTPKWMKGLNVIINLALIVFFSGLSWRALTG